VDDVAQIGRIIIKESQGHPTRIGDVARVEDGVEEPKTSAAEDGKDSVVLSVRKQSGQNTVAVVDGHLVERVVQLGPRVKDLVAIADGVKKGERVVVSPPADAVDGVQTE
jgi:Cu/Ag efflux pump CusA